jgi:hypothetical protein
MCGTNILCLSAAYANCSATLPSDSGVCTLFIAKLRPPNSSWYRSGLPLFVRASRGITCIVS